MITVNYWITEDVFHQSKFITVTAPTTEENMKKAFKAIKKYDACIFIDRQGVNGKQNCYNSTTDTDIIDFCVTGANYESEHMLVDYTDARKLELEHVKQGFYKGV